MTTDAKKLLRLSVLFIVSLFIVVYAFYRTKDLVFGVKIRDVSVTQDANGKKGLALVAGNAKNASGLYVDGREIPVDQSGNFQDAVSLLPGYNIVVIRAEDKFGHTDRKTYQLTYKPAS